MQSTDLRPIFLPQPHTEEEEKVALEDEEKSCQWDLESGVIPQAVTPIPSSSSNSPQESPSALSQLQRIDNCREEALEARTRKSKGFFKDKGWFILGVALVSQITAGLVATHSENDTTVKVVATATILTAIPAELYFVWHEYSQNKKLEQESLQIFQEMLDDFFERFKTEYPKGYPEVKPDKPEKMKNQVNLFFMAVKDHHKYYERSRQKFPKLQCEPPKPFEVAASELIASLQNDHPLLKELQVAPLFQNSDSPSTQYRTFPGESAALSRSYSEDILDKEKVVQIFQDLEQAFGVPLQWVEKNRMRRFRDGTLSQR